MAGSRLQGSIFVVLAGRTGSRLRTGPGSGLRAPGSGLWALGSGLQGSRLAVLAGRTGSRLRMRWSEARQGKN